MTDNFLKCSCGNIFPADGSDYQVCPRCGRRIINLECRDGIVSSEYLGMKIKKLDSKHKHGSAYESEQGVTTGKNGKHVFKRKVIDREHLDSPGSYEEYVRDKDGNIIVNKSEKLSKHRKV